MRLRCAGCCAFIVRVQPAPGINFYLAAAVLVCDAARLVFDFPFRSRLALTFQPLVVFSSPLCVFLGATAFFFFCNSCIFKRTLPSNFFFFRKCPQHHTAGFRLYWRRFYGFA